VLKHVILPLAIHIYPKLLGVSLEQVIPEAPPPNDELQTSKSNTGTIEVRCARARCLRADAARAWN